MDAENTKLTCPECHGPLQRLKYGNIIELKCRVGHAYSPASALVAHDEAEERVLWSAVEMLEEGADVAEQLADSISEPSKNVRDKIPVKRKLAKRIRAVIEEAE